MRICPGMAIGKTQLIIFVSRSSAKKLLIGEKYFKCLTHRVPQCLNLQRVYTAAKKQQIIGFQKMGNADVANVIEKVYIRFPLTLTPWLNAEKAQMMRNNNDDRDV